MLIKSCWSCSEMNPRYRSTMEDEHRIVENFGGDAMFFAVYDGHGGRQVVDYLKTALEQNFLTELDYAFNSEGGSRSVEEAFASAYLISDIETSRENLMVSGSTAVTCLLRIEGDRKLLYSANVGDTRAVLSRNGVARRLTFDHKANDPSEIRRIERKRVCGVLSVSRSFGDHGLKKYVLARPFTSCTEVRKDDANLLIIACDGVWDVFSDQDAVDFLLNHHVKSPQADLAQALVAESIKRGTTDNVTAIVSFI